jgi:hypothetical protein
MSYDSWKLATPPECEGDADEGETTDEVHEPACGAEEGCPVCGCHHERVKAA